MTAPFVMIPGIVGDAAAWAGMPAGEVMMSGADTIAAMASDILARAPDRFALAGHSMGGYIALAMIQQAPDRIERLALLSTSAAADSDEQRAARAGMMALAQASYPEVVELLLRAMLHRDARADVMLVGEMRAMARRAGIATFLRQQRATMARPDMQPTLSVIVAPTLVLHGEDDRVVAPERSAQLTAAIPNARRVMIAACGHAPQRERPAETLAALNNWLNG